MAGILDTISACITPSAIVGAVLLFFVASFIINYATRPSYPLSIPRVGHGAGFVGSIKDYFTAYIYHKTWVQEGYEKYTKHGKSFVVPSGFGRRSAVVLPRSQTKWLFDQPDNVLSPDEANNDSLYSKYNFMGKRDPQDPFSNRTIHKNLVRSLDKLIPGMQEEVQDSIDRVIGRDTLGWKKLNIWRTWLDIIPQITNRMVLGKDLARNPRLLSNMVKFTESVLRNILIFDFLSDSLHPLLGPLLVIPNWIYYLRAARLSLPTIRERLQDMELKSTDSAFKDWEEPEDFITWVIRQARSEGSWYELRPWNILRRTLLVEVASLHTTAMTAQNAMLDLLSSDPSILESLREEATQVFREENQKWTKAGLSRLRRIDSAIRESQRRSNFAVTMLDHKVIAPAGVTNKELGWHLPYGSTVTLNLHGVYHDPSLHKDPEQYDALRYSRPIEEYESRPEELQDPSENEKLSKVGIVTTSEEHLVFGHGRHACPGRFFVAHELKMAIAYMLLNYELKHVPRREPPSIMGNFILPPFGATMEVRRRKDTADAHHPLMRPFGASKESVNLTGAQETMLGTLFGRAQDAESVKPILGDPWAAYVLGQVDYDFSKLKMNHMQSVAVSMRSRTFDRWTSEFIQRHKDTGATIICLACGLDSRSLRLEWGPDVRWIDLDLPAVVALRRRLLPSPEGDYKLVAASVTEDTWLHDIPADRPTLIVAEGLVMYLTEQSGEDLVRRLVERFPSGEIALDAVGSLMISVQSLNRMLKATGTVMPWGFQSPRVLERADARLSLCNVVRFSDQDGADALPFAVRCVAWALSHVPLVKDLGWMLHYKF